MKRIWRRPESLFNKRRITGLCFLAMAVASAVIAYHTAYAVHDSFVMVSIFFVLIAINYIFLTPEGKKRVAKGVEKILLAFVGKLMEGIKLLADMAKNLVKKIVSKFSLSDGGSFKRIRRAEDYSDIHERIGGNTDGKRKKKIHKKFKNMDNVEKVRFLYEKKVTGAIKRGVEVEESMTPIEAGDVMIKEKYMRKSESLLIDTYNEARYNERSVITDEMVAKIK